MNENTPNNPTPELFVDPGANAPTGQQTAIDPKIASASATVLQQHSVENAAPGKRKPGRPRKNPIPLESLVDGSVPASLPAEQTFVDSAGIPNQQAVSNSADEESLRALVEGIVGLMEQGGTALLRADMLKATRDPKLAEIAAQGGKMSDETKAMIRIGGFGCVKKWVRDFQYASETAFFGGIAMYAGGVALLVRQNRTEVQKVSGQENLAPAPDPAS